MAQKVSSKTHTQEQLNDYANQNNPNNAAYKARSLNDIKTKNISKKHESIRRAKEYADLEAQYGIMHPLDFECYSNPYD